MTLKQKIHDFLLAASPNEEHTIKQLTSAIPEAANREETVARALRRLREEGKVCSTGLVVGTQELLWRRNDKWMSPAQVAASILAPMQPSSTMVVPPSFSASTSPTGLSSKPTFTAAVEALVFEFVSNKKAFSAWDITTELRSRSNNGTITIDGDETGRLGNGSPRIEHTDVRAIVHQMFDQRKMDGYDQESNGTFILYSPIPALPAVAWSV